MSVVIDDVILLSVKPTVRDIQLLAGIELPEQRQSARQTSVPSLRDVQHAAVVDAVAMGLEAIGVDRYFTYFWRENLTSANVTVDEVLEANHKLSQALNHVLSPGDEPGDS